MTPQHVISQLLESDTKYPNNLDLLKKILLTTFLGRFRVNGLAPDNKVVLGNYLFDEEHIMFDFTRLSEDKKTQFFQWMFEPHQNEKVPIFSSGAYVNEYRGFTAEVSLSWWGSFIGWLKNRYSEYWKITDLGLSLNYQLTGVEICHGKNGSLIGFTQFLVPPSGTKYKNPNDPKSESLGNTKRVFITDKLVDQLKALDFKKINFESMCKSPHPQSIGVADPEVRYAEMQDYRRMQKFSNKPWYIRFWLWLSSFFVAEEKASQKAKKAVDNNLTLLYETETTKIYQRAISKEILVKEKKPEINNLVFCGGGGKLIGHVGVWKALNEAEIRPMNFAGSSAGAIMGLLCYLGYTADEITTFFKDLKQEHLVFFDIDTNGLSDPHSLKTALDYAVATKVKQITTKYNIPYPQGKITFTTLDNLRKQCPDSGMGKELIVTATNKRLRKTRYFTLARTPQMEISEAVKISASFPVVYRGTVVDGDEHNDGGILSNFPTEAFSDDHSTLLESEYGNNLKVLAVQFDNGTERTAVDKLEEVYRENFFLNWIYGMLTGVKDPASAWERDRMKLRQYAAQSIVINAENISSSSFVLDEENRAKMIQNGYEATRDYLQVRYTKKENEKSKNKELMYATFNSLGELQAYCCYRGDLNWFDIVHTLITESSLPNRAALIKQSLELKQLYFNTPLAKPVVEHHQVTFFGNTIPHVLDDNHNILLALYPIFLKFSPSLLKSDADKKMLELARHSFCLQTPFRCLEYLDKIKDDNIIFHIFVKLIKELKAYSSESVYLLLKEFQELIYSNTNLVQPKESYGTWNLSLSQCSRVLKLFKRNQQLAGTPLLAALSRNSEPMQTMTKGGYEDDFSEENLEGTNTVSLGW